MLTIGSLFSGIGGLERAIPGRVIWQCENDLAARSVLAEHWPGVKRYSDVRDIDERTEAPDVIVGGFPCQDVSQAARGRNAGMAGRSSGLWAYMWRAIRLLRPRFWFVENVASGRNRWLPVVLGDMASERCDAEWGSVSAASVGAPFDRERTFVLGRSADGDSKPGLPVDGEVARVPATGRSFWEDNPAPVGVDDGVSARVDRLRLAGNAVVPQQAALAWRHLTARLKPVMDTEPKAGSIP